MRYLYDSTRKKTAAHIWMGRDTSCTMYSTGGLKKAPMELHDSAGDRRVCLMCQNNLSRFGKRLKVSL